MYDSIAHAVSKDHENGLWMLAKVGEKKHLERLADGALRFRRLSYYRQVENRGKALFDADEGLIAIYQPSVSEVTIDLPGVGKRAIKLSGPLTLRSNAPHSVFCLFAFEPGEWAEREITAVDLPNMLADITIPSAMEKYGDTVWVIHDAERFIDRVRRAVYKKRLVSYGQKVTYVELRKVQGKVPDDHVGFVKDATFSQEHEYRIRIDSSQALSEPFILHVGNLRDISGILPLKELRQSLSVHLPSVRKNAGKAD